MAHRELIPLLLVFEFFWSTKSTIFIHQIYTYTLFFFKSFFHVIIFMVPMNFPFFGNKLLLHSADSAAAEFLSKVLLLKARKRSPLLIFCYDYDYIQICNNKKKKWFLNFSVPVQVILFIWFFMLLRVQK